MASKEFQHEIIFIDHRRRWIAHRATSEATGPSVATIFGEVIVNFGTAGTLIPPRAGKVGARCDNRWRGALVDSDPLVQHIHGGWPCNIGRRPGARTA